MPSTRPAACVASSSMAAWLTTCWQKCLAVRSAVSLSFALDGWSWTALWASWRTVAAAEMLYASLPMYFMLYIAVAFEALPAPSVSGTAFPAMHPAMITFQSAMMPFRQTKAGSVQAASRRRSCNPLPSSTAPCIARSR